MNKLCLDTQIKNYSVYLPECWVMRITLSELARKMGTHEKMVRRILDPHHGTKLPTMERTLFALGKHAELHIT